MNVKESLKKGGESLSITIGNQTSKVGEELYGAFKTNVLQTALVYLKNQLLNSTSYSD